MEENKKKAMTRGYFAIGIENGKNGMNVGTLWRGASCFGAAYTFTIGKRFKRQSSDVFSAWKHQPHYEFDSLSDFLISRPRDSLLIGVEVDGEPLEDFIHPERAIYLLGPEDGSLSKGIREKCQRIVKIPGNRCLNVSQAGTVVMYDRIAKARRP